MAYFRSSCRSALIHIASPHSYTLPRLPSSSSLAYCWNAPVAFFRSRCRTALLPIAVLHWYALPYSLGSTQPCSLSLLHPTHRQLALFQGQSAFSKVGNSTPTIALDTHDDYSRRLPTSSLLAYYPNAPMAYFRSSCRTALLHIASLHSYALPRLPSSSLAHCSNAPLAFFRSRCRTALLLIGASLHSYALPPLPSSSLAYCSNAPMAFFRSRCRTALLLIASLHHTRCRVCPHPPRWPTD
jgi:hypothetical protein